MPRYPVFFENIQKDVKTYIFLLLLLCIYREAFIGIMHTYIDPSSGTHELLLSAWTGFRLSLKSAGILTLISFLFCTIPATIFPKLQTMRLRLILGWIYIVVLSILFQARIPYYQEFHVTFNQNIFNAANDDVYALFITMIQQYSLPLRLLEAAVVFAILAYAFKRTVKSRNLALPVFPASWANIAFRVILILLIPVLMLFIRFGGSFTYNHSINWENAAITKDTFLNEAILDDVQALYRAYIVKGRMAEGDKASGIDKDKIREYGKLIAGNNVESDNMATYLTRHAQGAKLQKPKHIFIIIGETYSQWPMMDKYKDLELANGIKDIASKKDAVYASSFMPNASFTAMAVSAMVTGLSDVSIPVNYQQRTYQQPYITSLAPQMQKLGYKVDFWYGGFPSWERIKDYTLAQGFDHFYSSADYGAQPDNIWGTKDEEIFRGLSDHLPSEDPTVHVILTVSNHPPYSLDLAAAGFDPEKVRAGLPEEDKNDDELIRKLGHYWYMDKVVHEFVQKTEEQYPDSLFIITGDHSDRVNVSKTPTPFERYSIPFVIYGKGISRDLFPKDIVGGQTNIMPTLIELLAPKGFTYYSIASSLTQPNAVGFNNSYWISAHAMGKIDNSDAYDELQPVSPETAQAEEKAAKEKVSMMRTISWWLLGKGDHM